ncbi:MAG: D-glycero-alpha-D-manno-heptose-1,7-bisphosphate 7-phosphatase [Verrucomicrobiales bacterium]
MTTPAFFFDRDGTVNISPGPGYVLRWKEFQFSPGVREMLAAVKSRGWKAILITSQQGVGKGLMTAAELADIHQRMQDQLGPNAAFDGIYACTGLDGQDPRRKPSPAMVLEAAHDHHLDLPASWNIGDKERDLAMGRAAGIPHNLLFGSPAFPDWATVLRHWSRAIDSPQV